MCELWLGELFAGDQESTYQLSPMKSWNLMGPVVVSASKSGAV